MRLVPNWKQSYKFASNWFHAAQIAAAGSWMILPSDLKASLPPKVMMGIAAFLGVGGFVARMIDQNKPQADPPQDSGHDAA